MQMKRILFRQVALTYSSLEGDGCERFLVVAPLEKESAQRELLRFKRLRQSKRDQPVVVRIRQTAKKNAVHYAENSRGSADSQRQCSDHRNRENRAASKPPHGITHIADHVFKPGK